MLVDFTLNENSTYADLTRFLEYERAHERRERQGRLDRHLDASLRIARLADDYVEQMRVLSKSESDTRLTTLSRERGSWLKSAPLAMPLERGLMLSGKEGTLQHARYALMDDAPLTPGRLLRQSASIASQAIPCFDCGDHEHLAKGWEKGTKKEKRMSFWMRGDFRLS